MDKEPEISEEIEIKHMEGIEYMATLVNDSVNLVLTDPPYIISRESGMNTHYNTVKENEEAGVEFVKTEEEWILYKTKNGITDDNGKENYLKS